MLYAICLRIHVGNSPDVFGEGMIIKSTMTEPHRTDVTSSRSVISEMAVLMSCGQRLQASDISNKQ